MATVRATQLIDQNFNILRGVQVDTAVYGGTGSGAAPAGAIMLRVGREASEYVIAGTQTAQVLNVILDTFNAKAGDKVHIKFSTGAILPTTSTIKIVNSTTDGTILTTSTGGYLDQIEFTHVFDGTQWR